MNEPRRTEPNSNFFYEHPALISTVVAIGIAGAFIGALYVSAQGHHGPAAHGSAHPAASGAPAASSPAGAPAHSAK